MSKHALYIIVLGISHVTSPLFSQTVDHFITLAAAQNGESCKQMREEAQNLMTKIEKTTDYTSPYSISILLLGAAYLKESAPYEKFKQAEFSAFKVDETDSEDTIVKRLQDKATENAWILGRLLIASLKMGDKTCSDKIENSMQKLLEKSIVDPFASWAWGYLALFSAQDNRKDYSKIKKRMMKYTDILMNNPSEKTKDNVLWSIILELQCFAETGDMKNYKKRLKDLVDFSQSSSVMSALETIPPADFRAWATSLVLHAAKKMKDKTLVTDLTLSLSKIIESSPSDADKMLALLVYCS